MVVVVHEQSRLWSCLPRENTAGYVPRRPRMSQAPHVTNAKKNNWGGQGTCWTLLTSNEVTSKGLLSTGDAQKLFNW